MKPGKKAIKTMAEYLQTVPETMTVEEVAEQVLAKAWDLHAERQRFIAVAQLRGPSWGTRQRIGSADAPDTWAFPPEATYKQALAWCDRAWKSPNGTATGQVWVVPIIASPREAWSGLQAAAAEGGGRLIKLRAWVDDDNRAHLEGMPGVIVEEDCPEQARAVMECRVSKFFGHGYELTWRE